MSDAVGGENEMHTAPYSLAHFLPCTHSSLLVKSRMFPKAKTGLGPGGNGARARDFRDQMKSARTPNRPARDKVFENTTKDALSSHGDILMMGVEDGQWSVARRFERKAIIREAIFGAIVRQAQEDDGAGLTQVSGSETSPFH